MLCATRVIPCTGSYIIIPALLDVLGTLIKPDMVQKYLSSVYLLQQCSNEMSLISWGDHTAIKNYLLINMTLNNCNRTWYFVNMTMGQFRQALEAGPQEGTYVINVS